MTERPHSEFEHTEDPELFAAFEGDVPAGTATPSALRAAARRYLPAALLGVMVLVVWETAVRALGIETFILAKPSEITSAFISEFDVVWSAGWTTFREALYGLIAGTLLGVTAALATARWPGVKEGIMPVAIAANSIPILALAPLSNQWFGLTSLTSKAAVVAIIVFFPIMINTVRGLTEVDPEELELMHSMAAPDRDIVRRVRIPHALPYFFSALKVAAALAVIGAIVAEYFGGRSNALGFYITQRAGFFQFAEAWAAIVVGSILGIAIYSAVLIAERLVMPWHVAFRAADDA